MHRLVQFNYPLSSNQSFPVSINHAFIKKPQGNLAWPVKPKASTFAVYRGFCCPIRNRIKWNRNRIKWNRNRIKWNRNRTAPQKFPENHTAVRFAAVRGGLRCGLQGSSLDKSQATWPTAYGEGGLYIDFSPTLKCSAEMFDWTKKFTKKKCLEKCSFITH